MRTNETKKTVHTSRKGGKFLNLSFLTAQGDKLQFK